MKKISALAQMAIFGVEFPEIAFRSAKRILPPNYYKKEEGEVIKARRRRQIEKGMIQVSE